MVKPLLTLLTVCLSLCPQSGEGTAEDFEGAVPEGWERISSDAHPPYNLIELVRDPALAKSGRQFVRFTSQGGSTALRRSFKKAWPVESGRPYRLSAWVRLIGTRRNTASLSLTWLNAGGAPLTEQRSAPAARIGEWIELSLEIPRAPEKAAGLSPRLDFEGDDIRGTCDFDAVTLAAVERIELRAAGRDAAIFASGEALRFDVTPAGLPPGAHTLTLTLGDVRRTATLNTPLDRPLYVEFPAPSPGLHELEATVEGRKVRSALSVLVPNPRLTTRRPAEIELQTGALGDALRGETADAEGRPTPLLLARMAADDVLFQTIPLPDAPVFPEPVRAAAYRHEETVRLALWTSGATVDVPLAFNEGARLYPSLGAIRPLKPGERVAIGPMPVFILDVDPPMVESRLQISNPDLPLQIGPSARTLRFRNPSRAQALRDVRIRLFEQPAGWRITPKTLSTPLLAAGADLSEELQLAVPSTESEGDLNLRFEIGYTCNGRETLTQASVRVRLISSIGLETSVQPGPRPDSKKLTIRVTNRTERSMTLSLRARLPNLPEQTELLRELGPGSRSSAFEYVIKDLHLVDPLRLVADLSVQESGGDRACAHQSLPLR